jgi:hypothetical protein
MLIMRNLVNAQRLTAPLYFAETYEANTLARSSPALRDLTQKIMAELPKFSDIPARVGIEVEAEKALGVLRADGGWPVPTWGVKEDGSLREGGLEFISPAIHTKDLPLALATLYAGLSVCRVSPSFSERTSIHVHIECLQMTLEQFKSFLLLYMVSEPGLFHMGSPGRRDTNIFCTPLTRTNFYSLSDFFAAGGGVEASQALSGIINEIGKYAALNFQHIYDFGTLEFRHIRGTSNYVFLAEWIEVLLRLYKAALTEDFVKLQQEILKLNTNSRYSDLTERVFGDLAPRLYCPSYRQTISQSVSLAKEIIVGKEVLRSIKKTKNNGCDAFMRAVACKERKDKLLNKRRYVSAWRAVKLPGPAYMWVHMPTLSDVGGAAVHSLRGASYGTFYGHFKAMKPRYDKQFALKPKQIPSSSPKTAYVEENLMPQPMPEGGDSYHHSDPQPAQEETPQTVYVDPAEWLSSSITTHHTGTTQGS